MNQQKRGGTAKYEIRQNTVAQKNHQQGYNQNMKIEHTEQPRASIPQKYLQGNQKYLQGTENIYKGTENIYKGTENIYKGTGNIYKELKIFTRQLKISHLPFQHLGFILNTIIILSYLVLNLFKQYINIYGSLQIFLSLVYLIISYFLSNQFIYLILDHSTQDHILDNTHLITYLTSNQI